MPRKHAISIKMQAVSRMMDWQEAMSLLDKVQLRWVIARLLGRSGLSDQEFVKICLEYAGEEE